MKTLKSEICLTNNMREERIDDNSKDSSYENFKDEPEERKIDCLKTEFERKFSKLNEEKIKIKLFSNPFNFPDEELDLIDLNLQMEVVDLKTNSFFKNKFLETRSSASDEIFFVNCCQIHIFQI